MKFLEFFEKVQEYSPMHLEIYYSKIMDWCLKIYKKQCGENGSDLVIFDEQSCDIDLLFARAEVSLKEYLLEKEGGY